MDQQEWLLKRNCSLSPRQLGRAYALLCALSCLVALICILLGVWQVIFFTVLELSAVALAFIAYARHATDREHILFRPPNLLVERYDGTRIHRVELDAQWARVDAPRTSHDLIHVQARGVQVDIGRYVTAARRREVARELQMRIPLAAQWSRAA